MSEMEDLYMAELISIAASQGLQGWEVPAGILLEPVPFTAEVSLTTHHNRTQAYPLCTLTFVTSQVPTTLSYSNGVFRMDC